MTTEKHSLPIATSPEPRRSLGQLALRWGWLLPLLAAFGPTLGWLWERWTRSVMDNGHGMFMPIVAAYLMREAGYTYEEARDLLKSKRKLSKLEDRHQLMLQDWSAKTNRPTSS